MELWSHASFRNTSCEPDRFSHSSREKLPLSQEFFYVPLRQKFLTARAQVPDSRRLQLSAKFLTWKARYSRALAKRPQREAVDVPRIHFQGSESYYGKP